MKLVSAWIAATAALAVATVAQAQQEFTPASGKGPPVVAVSGALGAKDYEGAAQKLASMGYDVFLLDGNAMVGDRGAGLRAGIQAAQHSLHALPGKVGAVGFSLGGGQVLGYAPAWDDQVAVVVVMYPLTRVFRDLSATVMRIKVPVLMFAGEDDHFRDNCCTVDRARQMAAIAKQNQIPLELVTYPGVGHDFVVESARGYNAQAAADAWSRTQAELRKYLGGP
jgi:dienelactone hydrolase